MGFLRISGSGGKRRESLLAALGAGFAARSLRLLLGIMDQSERFRGCLVGLAVGDAVGTTLEFRQRGTFEPLTDMVGGGPFGLRPGEWTDDTSMALCLATSLVERGGFDPQDQMSRYYQWAEAAPEQHRGLLRHR